MIHLPAMADFREQLYTQRATLASARWNAQPGERDELLERTTKRLVQVESGLYPTCEQCGERIEMERLQRNAMEARCAHCEAR